MKYAGIGEDGRREQRQTLLITQKAETKVLFFLVLQFTAARRRLSKSSVSFCLVTPENEKQKCSFHLQALVLQLTASHSTCLY